MNLKQIVQTINRMLGRSSGLDLRLRVGQRDEDFDLFGIAKGGGRDLVLKKFCSGWFAGSGSLRQVLGESRVYRRIAKGAEAVFGRQVQWCGLSVMFLCWIVFRPGNSCLEQELPGGFNWQSIRRGLGIFLDEWGLYSKVMVFKGVEGLRWKFHWSGLGVFSGIFLKVLREGFRKSKDERRY